MKQRKILIGTILVGLTALSLLLYHEHGIKSSLLKKYRGSEEAALMLRNTTSFHLYLNVHEKEPFVSPIDLFWALDDLKKSQGTDSSFDFITALARARHLLSPDYPTDFAVALARMENAMPRTFPKETSPFPFQDEKEKAFVNDIMTLAVQAYFSPDQVKNDRYKVIDYASDDNGFSATAFKDDELIVIAFRGADETKDLSEAQKILKGEMPSQFENALTFYKRLRHRYPNIKIRATGHSLGGSLAQLLAANENDVLAFTCNPVGAKRLIHHDFNPGNIFNLTVQNDRFAFALPQAGHSVTLESKKTDKYGDLLHPHSVLHCLKD